MNVYNLPLHFTLKDIIEDFIIKDFNKYPSNTPYILILPNKIARNICIQILSDLNLKNNIIAVSISDDKTLLKIFKKYSDSKHLKDINTLINAETITINKVATLITNLIQNIDYELSLYESFHLSKRLYLLLDIITAENISINQLKQLPVNSAYAGMLIKLLIIISEHWHNIMKEINYYSALDFKSKVFNLLTDIINKTNNIRIVAFGIDNFSSSISNFLNAVAHHKYGTVILNGIDNNLSKNDWENLLPTHPQYINAQILKKLNIDRESIPNIINDHSKPKENFFDLKIKGKQHINISLTQLLSSMFNIIPHKFNTKTILNNIETSATLENIHLSDPLNFDNTFNYINNIAYGELNDESDEAQVITLILKNKLNEKPNQKISIITTNFDLINRISSLLNEANIPHYNSFKHKLNHTDEARFFRLITTVDINNINFVNLLALLKHKLCKFSQSKNLIQLIDLYIAREPLTDKNLSGCNALLYQCFKQEKITEEEYVNIKTIFNNIEAFYKSFSSLNNDSVMLRDILNIHIELAEKLSIKDVNNIPLIWSNTSGKKLKEVLKLINIDLNSLPKFNIQNYNNLINSLLNEYQINPALDINKVNVKISGVLQARFYTDDIIFIADLNEGSFPTYNTKENTFISYILKQLKLPTHEVDIGKQAFIFMQLCHCKEVYLTRSIKKLGILTTPSRFLLKFQNSLRANNLNYNNEYLYKIISNINKSSKEHINESLDNVASNTKDLPSANPEIKYRPKQIKVTAIENLLKNPYIYFTENILKLYILQPINTEFNARLRGILIHEILDAFLKCIQQDSYNYELNSIEEILLKILKEKFAPYIKSSPKSKLAFYIISYFTPFLAKELYTLNKEYSYINSEVSKSLKVNFGEETISILGRADYIALSEDKELIIDFKTGNTTYNKIDIEAFRKQLIVLGYIELTRNKENEHKQFDLAYYVIPSNIHDRLNFVSLKEILNINDLNEYIYNDFENIKSTLRNFLLTKQEFIFNSKNKDIPLEYKHFSRIDSFKV